MKCAYRHAGTFRKTGEQALDQLTAVAISVGLFSGLWAYLSTALSISTWAGFIGCTTFFAAGGQIQGFKKAVLTNLAGVVWAMLIIGGGRLAGFPLAGAVLTGVAAFAMCIQARLKFLSFIPGTFAGTCVTFAFNGAWQAVTVALVCGAVLGLVAETGGLWLHRWLTGHSHAGAYGSRAEPR
ncbi:MAG: hypothetical protein PWR31_587 [Bacillota bacterium]|jgi:hypothetical protein|nr:hypothetical protein [Bacillota bacterium]